MKNLKYSKYLKVTKDIRNKSKGLVKSVFLNEENEENSESEMTSESFSMEEVSATESEGLKKSAI